MMSKPLCFVLMPFGQKLDAAGQTLDFDAIHRDLIKPAIEKADLDPIRADEEMAGGIIHKPMYEHLLLCEYAVADLTTANANVFYELGIRHAMRPHTTIVVFAEGTRLPFDLGPVRGLPYAVTPAGTPDMGKNKVDALCALLSEARKAGTDSPVFQLLNDMEPPDISRLKTDVFRDRVAYSVRVKEKLASARKEGAEAIDAIKAELEPIHDAESGVVVDLLLSYRAVKAWDKMVLLSEDMSEPVARTVLVQEQVALALNRAGRGDEAEEMLLGLVNERGPSSETYGILGRVYKDRWDEARRGGNAILARSLLDKAIAAYLRGFQNDWRDAYPGVNAITLMELRDPPDERRKELLPVVTYAVKRRIESGEPDYWDHATLLELAVLAEDAEQAASALGDALAAVREVWEPETTLNNLRLIRACREARGEEAGWMTGIESGLADASTRLQSQ